MTCSDMESADTGAPIAVKRRGGDPVSHVGWGSRGSSWHGCDLEHGAERTRGRDGPDREAYLKQLGELLTPEMARSALVDLVRADPATTRVVTLSLAVDPAIAQSNIEGVADRDRYFVRALLGDQQPDATRLLMVIC